MGRSGGMRPSPPRGVRPGRKSADGKKRKIDLLKESREEMKLLEAVTAPRFAALLIIMFLSGCMTPRTTLLPRGSRLGIAGDVAVSAQGEKATAASTAEDLGLSAERIFLPRIDFDWDRFHASAELFHTDYTGLGRAKGDLSFGNAEVAPSVPLETEASFDYVIGSMLYDFYVNGTFRLGAGIGAGMTAYDLYFKQITPPPLELALDDRLPFGYLTVRAYRDFGFADLLATASGLAYSSQTSDIDYLEFEGRAGIPLFDGGKWGAGSALVGYRYHQLKFIWTPPEGTLDLDLDLYGPYVGLGYTF